MNLYHGSYVEVVTPDLKHSRSNVDFGKGFYTTPLYDQAVKWCNKFKKEVTLVLFPAVSSTRNIAQS